MRGTTITLTESSSAILQGSHAVTGYQHRYRWFSCTARIVIVSPRLNFTPSGSIKNVPLACLLASLSPSSFLAPVSS